MSENNGNTNQGQQQENPPATPGTENPPADATPPADAGKGDATWDGLPEQFAWVKDKITSLNNESASYRTKLRNTEDELKAVREKTEAGSDARAEIDRLLGENKKAQHELKIERALVDAKLDPSFRALLAPYQDDDSLKLAAQTFARLNPAQGDTPPPPRGSRVPPSGGVDPNAGAKPTGSEAYRRFKEKKQGQF